VDTVLNRYMERVTRCNSEARPPCIITVSYSDLQDKGFLEKLGSLARRGVAVRVLADA